MVCVSAFFKAALPWIVMGLALAVFFAQNGSRKKDKEEAGDYSSEGMCLGMCLGTALGSSLGGNTGIGISLGMLIGLTVGSCMKKKNRDAS